jgi:hypothetical protein
MKGQNKSKKSAWFYVAIIFGIIFIYALVSQLISHSEDNEIKGNYSYTSTTSENNVKSSNTVSINGMNVVQTINYPHEIIDLKINGQYNIITVSKVTQISKLDLIGQYNKVNLCKDIHSPQINDIGQYNKVIYISC